MLQSWVAVSQRNTPSILVLLVVAAILWTCAADVMSSLQLVNQVIASMHSCHLVWQQLTFTAACVPLGLVHSLDLIFGLGQCTSAFKAQGQQASRH